ncbi:MAG: hypothetical protein FJ264_13370 [Planctomycetes bacterium]|nr:hypothetical protein [Planctomycetota bacterium]
MVSFGILQKFGHDPGKGKGVIAKQICPDYGWEFLMIKLYREGKQKMLVHMATGLGKTRTMVAFVKALLEYNMAKRVLFVVDRIMLAD